MLPVELLTLVLFELDPASFYICLQTSRVFRELALENTKLLYYQLSRVPGQRNIQKGVISNGGRSMLLRLFGKRAAQHLLHGVEQMADVHVWNAPSPIDRNASSLVNSRLSDRDLMANLKQRHETPSPDRPLFFFQSKSAEGVVNIYSIQASGLTLEHAISPYMIARHIPGYNDKVPRAYIVAKVAIDCGRYGENGVTYDAYMPDLAILYQVATLNVAEDSEAKIKDIDICMVVVRFHLEREHGPRITDIYDIPRSYALCKASVTDMILNSHGNPMIAYRTSNDRLESQLDCSTHSFCHRYSICTYVNTTGFKGGWPPKLTEKSEEIVLNTENPGITVGSFDVRGAKQQRIHLCPTTIPVPWWTLTNLPTANPLGIKPSYERRINHLPHTVEAFSRPSLGHVLATHHHHRIEDPSLNDGAPTCVNTALELMISRQEPDAHFGATRQGIFLLKALHYPDSCEPFDKDKDYASLQHVFVAELAGLDLNNLSSIGIKLAISPNSTRIAIAHWRSLRIYALDPVAFLDPEYAIPNGDGVPGDYAYIEGCGWQYYSSNRFEKECVVLEPVKLESKGVVFGLEWRNEDELWGWTDGGVVRWRMGVGAKGRKGEGMLDENLSRGFGREATGIKKGRAVKKTAEMHEEA